MKKHLRLALREQIRMLHPFVLYSPMMIADLMFPKKGAKKFLVTQVLARRTRELADPRGIAPIQDGERYWGFQWQATTVNPPKATPSATVPITKARLLCHYPMLAEKLNRLPDFCIPPHLLPPFFIGITVWSLGEPILDPLGRRRQTRRRWAGMWLASQSPNPETKRGWFAK